MTAETASRCAKLCGAKESMRLIKDGDRIMVGGFGNVGTPWTLIDALADSGVKDLTVISNDLGSPNIGLGKLLTRNKIRGLIGTYYNWNKEVIAAHNEKKISIELVPQGTFAEAIRAAGVGVAGFYVRTAVGTELAKGRELKEFNGKTYLLQEAIRADAALICADKADELGNLVYYKTARNFNPLMAMAASVVIAEVNEIVPAGSIDPETIVTPHLFVNRLVLKGA